MELFKWDLGPIEMMDGSLVSPKGYARLKFNLAQTRLKRNFVVMKTDTPLVLGMDFLKSKGAILDLGTNSLCFRGKLNVFHKILMKAVRIDQIKACRILSDFESVKIKQLLQSYPTVITLL